jgi:hypothetical protein
VGPPSKNKAKRKRQQLLQAQRNKNPGSPDF